MRAIVMRREPRKEVDETIIVYTKEEGKLSLTARGSKKSISKNSAHLFVGSLVDIQIVKGKEVWYVGSVLPENPFFHNRTQISKLLVIDYAFRLVDTVVQERGRDDGLFFLLESFLSSVEGSTLPGTSFIDAFLLRFAKILGFWSDLESCVQCGTKRDGDGFWDFTLGGFVCHRCAPRPTTSGYRLSHDEWNYLVICSVLSWNKLEEVIEEPQVHNAIIAFVIFETEKSLPDWGVVMDRVQKLRCSIPA